MPTDKVVLRADLSGVWKRVLLIDEEGTEDRQSEVYWVQTRRFCGDIRLHLLHSTLADLSANGDASRVDAFAGHLIGDEDTFRWEAFLHSRPINSLLPDEGRLSWIGDDSLHEDGVHRAYSERWQRVAVPSDDDFAVELRHPRGNRMSYLLRVGQYVFFASGARETSTSDDESEFSLFEMHAEGPRLVLSTVDAALVTCPVTEDVRHETDSRGRHATRASELQNDQAGSKRKLSSIAGLTP